MDLLGDSLTLPGNLYKLERQFWFDLWRVPIVEAVEEDRIEYRRYGNVHAFAVGGEPHNTLFNLVLGAGEPFAVEDGDLVDALDWTESLGVDCRVPLRPDFGEPDSAEEFLNQRGYRRTASLVAFMRDGSPPEFPEPPRLEVDYVDEVSEGFSTFLGEGYGLDWSNCFFFPLPGRYAWRSYIAVYVDGETEEGIGAATMMMHPEGIAQLAFASVSPLARGRGAHLALLHRRIADACAAGAHMIFAMLEEPLDFPRDQSSAAANLARAGFAPVGMRTVWRPPASRIADEDEDEYEYEDEEDDDDDDDDGGVWAGPVDPPVLVH